jgi:regulatory protein
LRYGFLNDELYAKDYANLLSARGYGKYVIARKLREKHLSEDFICAAISQVSTENNDAKRAFDFKIRMLKTEKDPKKHREKLYRFMLTRGFSGDIIRQLYEEYLQENQ